MGAMKDAVRVVFRGPRVSDLFDRDWHKIALSIQAQNVSLYIDCALVQTLPIEERENIDIQGKTVIGKRLYDSVPIDVSTGGPPVPKVLGSPEEGSLGSQCPHLSQTRLFHLSRHHPGLPEEGRPHLGKRIGTQGPIIHSCIQLFIQLVIFHMYVEHVLHAGHCAQQWGHLCAFVFVG